ncbi:MAG: hypothetical protein V4631_03195 [Pseudomonadota bacterium]
MDRAPINRQRGGVLIAVAGVILIVALSIFAVAVMRQAERKLDVTKAERVRLDTLDAVLAQFVSRHRRLPCPANGGAVSGALAAGIENINGAGQCVPANQSDGVVPWSTLGLTEQQATNAWGGRISYRVQPSLASNLLNLMNMSWCDPAGLTTGTPGAANACLPSPCFSATCMHPNNYLYGKGLQVQDGAGVWLNRPAPVWAGAPTPPPLSTGAAYVLISHGANGAGAYNANGIRQQLPGAGPELSNTAAVTGATIFIDKAPVDTPGAYFDDVLSHPTLATVLANAALGPRTPH